METISTAESILAITFLALQILYFVLAGLKKRQLLKLPENNQKSIKYNIFIAIGAGVLLVGSSFLLFTVIDNYIINKVLVQVDVNHDDMYCVYDELSDTYMNYNSDKKLTDAEAIAKYGKEYVEECKVLRKAVNDTGRNLYWLFLIPFCVIYCPIIFGLLFLIDRISRKKSEKQEQAAEASLH